MKMLSAWRIAAVGLVGCSLPHRVTDGGGQEVVQRDVLSEADTVNLVDVQDVVLLDVRADVVVRDVIIPGDVQDSGPCMAGQTLCGTSCVDLATDAHYCGSCTNDCTGLAHVSAMVGCSSGQCVVGGARCQDGFENCDMMVSTGCEADLTSSANCGACGATCSGTTPVCQPAGATPARCVANCVAPVMLCGSTCADLTSDENNCGMCSNVCSPPPDPTEAMVRCQASHCEYPCIAPFAECDGNDATICETDTSSSVAHCGGCGMPCTVGAGAHATPTCASSTCGFTCDTHFQDCNVTASDGCEVDTDLTVAHCGSCSNDCLALPHVATGRCNTGTCLVDSCAPNFDNCNLLPGDGCEVDLTTDVNHCGACGTACAASGLHRSAGCVSRGCTALCDAGFHATAGATDCHSGDDCGASPSEAFNVTLAAHTEWIDAWSTTGLKADEDGTGLCLGATGRDAVYHITPAVSGMLEFTASASGFLPIVYVRSVGCGGSQIACERDDESAGNRALLNTVQRGSVAVTGGTDYYLVVDSASAAGPYALRLYLNTCGDGVLATGEACEDGNTLSGDGCSSTCTMEVAALTDDCTTTSSSTLPPSGRTRGVYTGTLNTATGTSTTCTGAASTGPDYSFASASTTSPDKLWARFTETDPSLATANPVVYPANPGSGCISAMFNCIDDEGAGLTSSEIIHVPFNDMTRWSHLDSAVLVPATTTFKLEAEIEHCGDGERRGGEECDSATVAACQADCTLPPACHFAVGAMADTVPGQTIARGTCPTFEVTGSMAKNKQEYLVLPLTQGQVVYTTVYDDAAAKGFGYCGSLNDLYLEVFPTAPAMLTVGLGCAGSTAAMCVDDVFNGCPELTYVAPADGMYTFRLVRKNTGSMTMSYNLHFEVH